jgi:hypothetical protein
MPVLSKAQLFGSLSRPALDEIKKELSPEVKDLLRDELKIQQGFIEGLGRTIDNTPNKFKQQLRRKLDDDALMVTPSRRGKGANYPDTDRPKVLDKTGLMVALNSHLDMFIDIKKEFDKIPALIMAQFREGQLEDFNSIREYVADDVADLLIDRPRMPDYVRTAIDTLKEIIKRLKGQKTPKKENPEFIKSLTKLLENYAESPIREFWFNEFNEVNKITDLRNQKNVNRFLTSYENGKLSVRVLDILNADYDGDTGIDILKEILKKLGMKVRVFAIKDEPKLTEYFSLSLSKLLDSIENAMNTNAGKKEIEIFFKHSESKLKDYADLVEERLLDLLDDEEEFEFYYNEVPTKEVDAKLYPELELPKEHEGAYVGIADIKNEAYKREIETTTQQYAFLYYVGKLRGIELDSSLLTNEISNDYSEDKLPEIFEEVKDYYTSIAEEEE